MSKRLAGQVALVTGAATGIGRAIATVRGGRRQRVVRPWRRDLDSRRATAAASRSRRRHRGADIAVAIAACGGRLDIVVNAAGLMRSILRRASTTSIWRRAVRRECGRADGCLPGGAQALIAARGCVVNVASVAAFNASPNTIGYAASKSALVSYTRSLAHAHGADGVRANCVAPGWVRTPMSEMEMRLAAEASGTTPEMEFEALAARIALRRVATTARSPPAVSSSPPMTPLSSLVPS